MRRVLTMVAVLGLSAIVTPDIAAESAPVSAGVVMPETESWDMSAAEGGSYRIFVSRPSAPAPAGGYPVLYVLDGNAMFAGFAEARRIHKGMDDKLDQMIVVAIGYPIEEPYDFLRRMEDFTPDAPVRAAAAQDTIKQYKVGGQDRFLSFILDKLRPEIARRYSINKDQQSLFGHSLGGLFALHVQYARPDAFHAIIAASPSIWWDDQAILAEERAFAARMTKPGVPRPVSRLLLLVGGREDPAVMGADAASLADRLKPLSAYGLRSEFQSLDGETHMTVPARAVTITLRTAMSWP